MIKYSALIRGDVCGLKTDLTLQSVLKIVGLMKSTDRYTKRIETSDDINEISDSK